MSREIGNGILSVSCVQFDPISANTMDDVDRNTDRILEYMDRAAVGNPGTDIVVFPECCFQGCAAVNWIKVALTLDSEPVRRVREKCRDLQMWGIFNPWIKPDDGTFIENLAIVVDDEGEIVGKYVKMNPAVPFEQTKPGREMTIIEGPQGAKMAILICSDSQYPELWREAGYKGANVAFHISHWLCPFEEQWEITNRAGALYGGYPVIAVNSFGTDEGFSSFGNSMVVAANGHVNYLAPQMPCIFSTTVAPAAAEAARINGMVKAPWSSYHRGAACPDQNGIGLDYSDYAIYRDHIQR